MGNMSDMDMEICIQDIAGAGPSVSAYSYHPSYDVCAASYEPLKKLYDELRIPIYKFALSIVKSPDTAEDIMEDAFLRIRAGAKNYRPKGKPRAWIFSIVHNLAVSELRKKSGDDIDEFSETLEDTRPSLSSIENIEAISMLDCLKPDEKEIVTLHVLGDLKHSEIAAVLRIPYEKVRWKYAYAIHKLKKQLTDPEVKEGALYENEKIGIGEKD